MPAAPCSSDNVSSESRMLAPKSHGPNLATSLLGVPCSQILGLVVCAATLVGPDAVQCGGAPACGEPDTARHAAVEHGRTNGAGAARHGWVCTQAQCPYGHAQARQGGQAGDAQYCGRSEEGTAPRHGRCERDTEDAGEGAEHAAAAVPPKEQGRRHPTPRE
eukprot:scaffold6639_cov63-Phaeocystis_antarctica.AAC.2